MLNPAAGGLHDVQCACVSAKHGYTGRFNDRNGIQLPDWAAPPCHTIQDEYCDEPLSRLK